MISQCFGMLAEFADGNWRAAEFIIANMDQNRIEDLIARAESSKNDSSLISSKVVFPDEASAAAGFVEYCRRLLNIEDWEASSTPSSYELFDENATVETGRPIRVGLFIRISVAASGKHDWVRVVSIREDGDEMILTVSPSFNPTERPPRPDVTSHFFGPEATNNFCLQRSGRYVSMYVIGLDEHQNTKHASGVIEAARNVAAAMAGSYLGLQRSLWREFSAKFLASLNGAEADR